MYLSLLERIQQKKLRSSPDSKLYKYSFDEQLKDGEIHHFEGEFYSLSEKDANELLEKIQYRAKRYLLSGDRGRTFGFFSRDKKRNKYTKGISIITGVNDVKTNFTQQMNPGGVPPFAYTRLVFDNMKDMFSLKPEENLEDITILNMSDCKKIKKKALLRMAFASFVLTLCVLGLLYFLLTQQWFSVTFYGVIVLTAFSFILAKISRDDYEFAIKAMEKLDE